MVLPLLVSFFIAVAGAAPSCGAAADAAFSAGYAAQQRQQSGAALAAWTACLAANPDCAPCLWEQGWTHWSRRDWNATVQAWSHVQAVEPLHPGIDEWLQKAKDRAAFAASAPRIVPMGTVSASDALTITLVGRLQSYRGRTGHPADRYEPRVNSPKSVRIAPSGDRVYINSLEGYETLAVDATSFDIVATIPHAFDARHTALFPGETPPFDYAWNARPSLGTVNEFRGKPVESAFSHQGRFLWVPYYRRSFDRWGTSPSAIAVIDTASNTILRVFPTGPIPKYVAVSPDSTRVAVTHWGDNTVMLFDTTGDDPAAFHPLPELMISGSRLPLAGLEGVDRDDACGYCLRGTVFTPDGRTLLVARMGGGGISGFDVESRAYLGTVTGMQPTPRHLVVAPKTGLLYLSSNQSGHVSSIPLDTLVTALRGAKGTTRRLDGWRELALGGDVRTIEITEDERWLFAAVHTTAELVVVDTTRLAIAARTRVDPFTVGLDVSPDGTRVWTTSQGTRGIGGHSVGIYEVRFTGAAREP